MLLAIQYIRLTIMAQAVVNHIFLNALSQL